MFGWYKKTQGYNIHKQQYLYKHKISDSETDSRYIIAQIYDSI